MLTRLATNMLSVKEEKTQHQLTETAQVQRWVDTVNVAEGRCVIKARDQCFTRSCSQDHSSRDRPQSVEAYGRKQSKYPPNHVGIFRSPHDRRTTMKRPTKTRGVASHPNVPQEAKPGKLHRQTSTKVTISPLHTINSETNPPTNKLWKTAT